MKIERWFQGMAVCGGRRPDNGYVEPGNTMNQCLFTQATYIGADVNRLADIVSRHFSDRVTCQPCSYSPIMRVIHFNNHELTTREDIDKVLRVFTEEQERDARPI